MIRKTTLIAALAALLLLSNLAIGQTTLPLNTGYDHSVFNPYMTVLIDPTPPLGHRDNYWMNIASYLPPVNPPLGPSWVLKRPSAWAAALPGSNWISAIHTATSPSGINANNPGYTIFRKCFCLLPGYHDASLIFRVRADNSIQVWFNTQLNQVLAPQVGNFNGPALGASTTNGFHVGRNCVYALVEDQGGLMGFDLMGSVTAWGLLPTAGMGTDVSFEPCSCKGGPAGMPNNARAASEDDQQVIAEIVKIAEARRAAKQKKQ